DHLLDAAGAVTELKDLHRDLVRRQDPLRRQNDPALPCLIEFQLGMPRQARPAGLADGDVAALHGCHRFASDWPLGLALVLYSDAFSLREPVSTSLENALTCLGNKRARRYVAFDIGMVQRIELNP